MTYLAELASMTFGFLHDVSFGVVLLPLLAWSALSFGFAVLLGRAIRRADERAGVLDEAELAGVHMLDVSEAEAASLGAHELSRREPTRSGPFLIDRGVQASMRANVQKAKQKA